jgi:hypothetical protein
MEFEIVPSNIFNLPEEEWADFQELVNIFNQHQTNNQEKIK